MTRSNYLSLAFDEPVPGEALVFSYVRSSFVKLDAVTTDAVRRNDFSNVTSGNMQGLLDAGIVVESSAADLAAMRAFMDELLGGDPFTNCVTVLTTFDCNFACTYCFEEHARCHQYLDERTADAACDWLIARMRVEKQEKLEVCFYGGEPLLNKPMLLRVAKTLHEASLREGFEFECVMITNGSLLDAATIDEMVLLGLTFVRVSVDGRKAYHDSRRPFKGGAPTHDVVMQKIRMALDKVPVGIACTFEMSDCAEVIAFAQELFAQGLMKRLASFGAAPVAPRLGTQEAPGRTELSHCDVYAMDPSTLMGLFDVYRALIACDAPFKVPVGVNACPLIMKRGGYVIEPDGNIGRCNAFVGYPQFRIGSVFDKTYDAAASERITGEPWLSCPQDCAYLPACQGGCRQLAFTRQNDIKAVCCRKEYFDRMMPGLLRVHYEHLLRKNT